MSIKKRKIGRGLSSLLGDLTFSEIENQVNEKLNANGDESETKLSVLEIPVEKIRVNPNQPRKSFDDESINELAESIKESGILQPIIVEKSNDNTFIIIAGERRYRASKIAGLQTIPCTVRNFNEAEKYVVSMIENIQRSNLNPMEEALGYKTIAEQYGLSHAEIAKMLGKSRSHVANMIGILSMPKQVHEMLSSGEISTGHAKVLKRVSNAEQLGRLAKKVKDESLSVRALEKHIEELEDVSTQNQQKSEQNIKEIFITDSEENPSWNTITPQEILAMEDAFNANFPQMIHIQHNIDGSGKIIIHYSDIEELRGVISKMIDMSDIYAK